MQFRFNAAILAIALAGVSATPLVARTESACNTGNVQCCNTTMSTSNPGTAALAGILGLVGNLGANIGLNCLPINIVALGGNACSQQTVCCTGNQFNGLVAVGCTPINVGL
ncbi:fungal hydrophobin [Coprinopsis marcescibilis]|uniref:Hydrophobin n=1 Tax=Coprinopsis marcescibilis TaxID=230819 RepID=A0A5C3LBL3_COPMA|nr:fungal hydrophobin [Coprinopsis marcescibilis]